jgi:hypothetical protein
MGDDDDVKWYSTNVCDGHARDRGVEDAIRELYMNALDGAQEAGQPENDVSFDADDKKIEISNTAKHVFCSRHMRVGPNLDDPSDPNKMGRHSLGLKDALAVLIGRSKWQIELQARGKQVRFEFQDTDGDRVLHYGLKKPKTIVGAQEAQDHRWTFTITVTDDENVKELVDSIKSDFVVGAELGEAVFTDPELNVAVYKPNYPGRKKKAPCFRHKQKKAGIYIGKRFVRLAYDSEVSYFGYHIQKVPQDIKELINRDQILRKRLTPDNPLGKLLQNFLENNREKLPLPELLCRELKVLLRSQPEAEDEPEDRPFKRKQAGLAGNYSPTNKEEDEQGSQTYTPPDVCYKQQLEEAISDSKKLRRQLADLEEKNTKLTPPPQASPSPPPPPSSQSTWAWQSKGAKAWYQDFEHTSDCAAFLLDLNKWAMETFPEGFAQVVPYGSVVYQIEVAGKSDVDATLMICSSVTRSPIPQEHLAEARRLLKEALAKAGNESEREPGRVGKAFAKLNDLSFTDHCMKNWGMTKSASKIGNILKWYTSTSPLSPTQMLTRFEKTLKKHMINVRSEFGSKKHPRLVVQKDNANGVPSHVDISFDGHLEVHKSREVGKLLDQHKGGRPLALLVKTWMYAVRLKRPHPEQPCLSSHAWMLLVIEYMSRGGEQSERGFFEWFLNRCPASDACWQIGKAQRPFEFERENVARAVQERERQDIRGAATEAIAALERDEVPWAGFAKAAAAK